MIKKMIAADWLAMKSYQKVTLFFLLNIPIICFIATWTVLLVVGMWSLIISIYPFGIEEKDDLNYLYLTLPLKRSDVVTGRYALSCISFICGILISSVFIPIAQPFSLTTLITHGSFNIGFSEYFIILAASYLIFAILNLSMFPFLFKLGYAKGKIWGLYLPLAFIMILITAFGVIMVIKAGRELLINAITYIVENSLLMSMGMTVLATIILVVSYLISLKVYSKRDF